MKNKQFNLFEDQEYEEKEKKQPNQQVYNASTKQITALKLSKFDNKKESKQKKLITSRLEKIKKLNSLLEKDRLILDKMKKMYHDLLSEDIKEYNKVTVEFAEKLIKRYAQKSFSQTHRRNLEYLIEECFDNLQANDFSIEKASALVNEYNELKESYHKDLEDYDDVFEGIFRNAFNQEDEEFDDEEFDDEEFVDEEFVDEGFDDEGFDDEEFVDELHKSVLKQMLNDMGLEVDDDFFEGLDPNDPDFEAKFQQRTFEYAKQQSDQEAKEEKRQKVITTDKEFTRLYKNLAKKIHPDLTTDEKERQRREILMKELSEIWENRDYYELLAIQARIDPNLKDEINLSEKQLKQIADDLYQKIESLESERFMFKRMPENEFYFANFFARTDKKIKDHLEAYKLKIMEEVAETHNRIQYLKNQQTTKTLLKKIDDELDYLPW